jgi:hypothetical protein
MSAKILKIKVLTPSGQLLNTWNEASFDQIVKEMGAEINECVINLNKKFDYSGVELALGNFVEIWAYGSNITTNESLTEKLIFKGFISLIQPYLDRKKEGISVRCLSHASRLSSDILKDGTTTTLFTDTSTGLTKTSPGSAADIGLVMRTIIDRYRAETSNPQISYTFDSIPDVSVDVLYSFECKTYKEALDKLIEVCPANYFYFIDELGIVWLKQKSSTIKHKFTIGLNTTLLKIEKSLEKIKNFVLIWNGEPGAGAVYKHYQDDTSISLYGRRTALIKDYGTDEDGFDLMGAKFIADNKNPDFKVYSTISNYYIESIEPGDSCAFFNFDEIFSDVLSYNLVISKVVYKLNEVEIQADLRKSGIVDMLTETKQKLEDQAIEGIPASYS